MRNQEDEARREQAEYEQAWLEAYAESLVERMKELEDEDERKD